VLCKYYSKMMEIVIGYFLDIVSTLPMHQTKKIGGGEKTGYRDLARRCLWLKKCLRCGQVLNK